MSVSISPQFAAIIQNADFTWFTTVRADGMPQPTPVWFIWDQDTFLIYSMPNVQKVRNIRQNPKVALSFATDDEASGYLVIMGEAVEDSAAPLAHQNAAYVAKYTSGIQSLGMTPESMGQAFSTAIRVRPERVRGEGG
jgi:PPOX class probable F420-dependent enzyme